MLVEWRFKKPYCHKKEPPSSQLGSFSSIYSLGRCASHSIPFKVKYIFLIPCLLECPSLHLHISPMSFHPSWPTFRPGVRSKYLHRLSDTTLLHTCIQLPGGLKHSIEFLQHWKGVPQCSKTQLLWRRPTFWQNAIWDGWDSIGYLRALVC